jgi:ribosomal protein S11
MQYKDLLSKQKNTINTISQKQNKKIKPIFVHGKSFIHVGRVFFKEFKEIEGLNNEPTSKKPIKIKPALESLKKKDFRHNRNPKKPEAWIKNEDLVNLDREFVNGKRTIKIDAELFEEVEGLNRKPRKPVLFGKTSPDLKPFLKRLKENKEDFRLNENKDKPWTVVVQIFLKKNVKTLHKNIKSLDKKFVNLKTIKEKNQGFRVDPRLKKPNTHVIRVFPDIEYPKSHEKKFVNDKPFIITYGNLLNNLLNKVNDFLNQVKASNKKAEPAVYTSKTSLKLIKEKKKIVIPNMEYAKSPERKFIDGKRSIIIDGDLFEEVEALGKTADNITSIGKKSPNLKPTLQRLKKNNRTFRLDPDPKSLNTWIIHEFKPDPIKAIMRIQNKKRNIFCTLSTLDEKLLASTTTGQVKSRKKGVLVSIKGRERQSPHNIRLTGFLVQKEILKYNVTQIRLHHTGNAPNKKKKNFLKCIKGFNSLQIEEINRPAPRGHNGNRPKKIRRK